MSKIWWIAAVVVLTAAGGGTYAWRHRPLSLALTQPTRGPAVDAVYAAGSVEPTVTQPIASKVMGRLTAVLADEGDTVRKGQVLARLEAGDLQSSVDEALARQKWAQVQYARTQELVKQHFVAPVELDRAQADLDAAQATVKRTQALRDVLTLVAPADGIILKRDGEVGQVIPAGQVLMTMACCAPLRATVDVDEEDIGRVHKGQTVVLRADALPGRTLHGQVSDITPKGDPISRSYRVRIKLDQTQGLLAGMTVEANLVVLQRDQALLVPSSAVQPAAPTAAQTAPLTAPQTTAQTSSQTATQTAAQKEAIWVMQNGRAHRQAVEVGIAGTTKTEVLSGLADGAQVITQPPPDLTEGRAVRALQP